MPPSSDDRSRARMPPNGALKCAHKSRPRTPRRGGREELRPLLELTSGDDEVPSAVGLRADSGGLMHDRHARPVIGEQRRWREQEACGAGSLGVRRLGLGFLSVP
ncbi:hypothetical protein V6Z12_D13G063600 [Gossypium hirsutum]|uniref:Uncharacterized protein n=1 Tax=Gossypium hirsutum TaxID=3635 RepID=A0A1U8KV64_GOSHI|nr:uncharacterized protein LOC107919770 [Gossypium hirsutum]